MDEEEAANLFWCFVTTVKGFIAVQEALNAIVSSMPDGPSKTTARDSITLLNQHLKALLDTIEAGVTRAKRD